MQRDNIPVPTVKSIRLASRVLASRVESVMFSRVAELLQLMWSALTGLFRSRVLREAEIAALRHQLNVLHRQSPKRPTFSARDRLIFIVLFHIAPRITNVLKIVEPETAVLWHRRDCDGAYGAVFKRRLRAMGISDKPTAPRSPWQNGHHARLIGLIRREWLNHVVIFGERHLRHVLLSYHDYYNGARTHLALRNDTPISRAVLPIRTICSTPVLIGSHRQYGFNLRQGQASFSN